MTAQNGASTFAVHAACIRGIEAVPVTVEISASGSIPGLTIVGMVDTSVLEARGRIRCALRSAGFDIPRTALTVSLTPGDIRKGGTAFDLPIAIAILALSGQIPTDGLDECLFAGEVSLDGRVCGLRGEVAYQVLARDSGLMLVTGPSPTHVGMCGERYGNLSALGRLNAGIEHAVCDRAPSMPSHDVAKPLDYSDVLGQEIAKRGMVVAATGDLGMLMVGSPGSGKSMLAKRVVGILPDVEESELIEALCIHSVVGEPIGDLLHGKRPFRSPHHSISTAGLVGGGRPVRPGEISLAHGGVLFLDELAEFPSTTLQSLRQPMEEGSVRVVRIDGAFTFPSRFQLLAASNPCPCGYLGDRKLKCTCSEAAVSRYRSKLTGPLADRIDMILDVARPDPDTIVRGVEGMSTREMRAQVEAGRGFRLWRERRQVDAVAGDEVSLDAAVRANALDGEGEDALVRTARSRNLTGRGIKRLCRIARTVADLEESAKVGADHILEAAQLQGRRGDDGE